MKRMIIGLFIAVSFVMFSSSAMAATIKNGPHDLRAEIAIASSGLGTNGTEICIYCHTPHNAGNALPLWNRTPAGTAAFTRYTSSSMDMFSGAATNFTVGSVSLQCLSCHDGATSIDAVVRGQVSVVPSVNIGNAVFTASGIGGNLGTDLTNDHPVGFAYDTSKDAAFYTLAIAAGNGVKFYEGNIECASCHDVHSANFKFLRVLNTNSDLCLSCHIK